ncbi:N-acetyltransferase [Rhodobacteraceae bacterium 63075]|nr:N-acetyltransferase [Rhodobacteraceae bacterium 63075]
MEFRSGPGGLDAEIIALFSDTFTASEGAEEGRLIGDFVSGLLADTHRDDLRFFTAHESGALAGAVVFSRLRYPGDAREVFILSPMAVRPDMQRGGIGQRLITHGLDALREEGARYALTYGDPAYYAKTGFQPVDEGFAPAPLPLSMPQGWLGQPLQAGGEEPFRGTPACVPALDNPALW